MRFTCGIHYINSTSIVQICTDVPSAHFDCTYLTKCITNTLLAGTLCLLGLVGNSVSFVLMMDEDSKVAAIQLQTLAFTDNLFLAMWFLHLWHNRSNGFAQNMN